jgi:hypothetical protein
MAPFIFAVLVISLFKGRDWFLAKFKQWDYENL